MEINFALWDAKKLARADGLAEGRAEGRTEGEAAAEAKLQPIIDAKDAEISQKDARIAELEAMLMQRNQA